MSQDTVREYYDRCGRLEWDRLTSSAYNQVEHTITLHILEKYLPPRGVILDAGGGPGRYTIELARRGYEVVLMDLSPVQLDIAREELSKESPEVQARVLDFVEGSIVDMSMFPNGHFDSLICLGGTLSHLVEVEDREKAANELARVCRSGAAVFVSVLSFYGVLRKMLTEHMDDMHMIPEFLRSRLNPACTGFADCFFFTPEEMVDLLARKGIEIQEYVGVQGLSAQLREVTENCSHQPDAWSIWKDVLVQTCNHPSVVGVSDHILAIGYI